jgi:hypothetical protein
MAAGTHLCVSAGCSRRPGGVQLFTLKWTEEQTPRAFADALLAFKGNAR